MKKLTSLLNLEMSQFLKSKLGTYFEGLIL